MNSLTSFANTTITAFTSYTEHLFESIPNTAPGFPSGRQIVVGCGLALIAGIAVQCMINWTINWRCSSLRNLKTRVIDNPNNHPLHAEATQAAIRGMQHTDLYVRSAALTLFECIVDNKYTPSYLPAFQAAQQAQQAQVHNESFIESTIQENAGRIFAALALCNHTPAYSKALEFVKKYRNHEDPLCLVAIYIAYKTLAWLVEQQYPGSYPVAVDLIREARLSRVPQALSICKTLVSRRYIPLYPTARSVATQCIDKANPQWHALSRDILKELLLQGDEESYPLALPIARQAIHSTNEDEQNWAKDVETLIACQPTILTLERAHAAADRSSLSPSAALPSRSA